VAIEGVRWFAEARVIGGLRRDRRYCTVILAVREWATRWHNGGGYRAMFANACDLPRGCAMHGARGTIS